jgi:peptidoglycan hydrolase FlgJ
MNALALDPGMFLTATAPYAQSRLTQSAGDKLHTQAKDFEAMFLSSMMQHMFTAIGKDGPLGNGQGVGVWRSMLTDQYAKAMVKSGGIGIANQIYKSMLARQGAKAA